MGNLPASLMKMFKFIFSSHQFRSDSLLHSSNSSKRPNFSRGSIHDGGGGGEAAAVYSSFTSLPLTLYEGSSVEPTLAGSETRDRYVLCHDGRDRNVQWSRNPYFCEAEGVLLSEESGRTGCQGWAGVSLPQQYSGFQADNCGLLHPSKLPAQVNSAGTAHDLGVMWHLKVQYRKNLNVDQKEDNW